MSERSFGSPRGMPPTNLTHKIPETLHRTDKRHFACGNCRHCERMKSDSSLTPSLQSCTVVNHFPDGIRPEFHVMFPLPVGRSERMRWIEATTPSQQVTDDERIYEAWGTHAQTLGGLFSTLLESCGSGPNLGSMVFFSWVQQIVEMTFLNWSRSK